MSDFLTIQSHAGPYQVDFGQDGIEQLNQLDQDGLHVLIDERVAGLYGDRLGNLLKAKSVLLIEAVEPNKGLECFPAYVQQLMENGVRRDHRLIVVGGGIIQDIGCFLAATMLRGIPWHFFPTTLLAQADSCIGSKSSINCGAFKNILGTFTPPQRVVIDIRFLASLDDRDIRSGVGEMLKIHAIAGPEAFEPFAAQYDRLFTDDQAMGRAIRRSLEIKQSYIETDEFDRGPRLVLNYGHSFGHAIEAATHFAIPHGIAVTIGMDMANYLSWQLGRGQESLFSQCHLTLAANFLGFAEVPVPLTDFIAALSKDKKNLASGTTTLILPDSKGRVERVVVPADADFVRLCGQYLESVRRT